MTSKRLILSLILGLSCLRNYASVAREKCPFPPLSRGEEKKYKTLAKTSQLYKNLTAIKGAQTTVNVSRCKEVTGNINISYIPFENIDTKFCSINSVYFSFIFKKGEIRFPRFPFKKFKIQPKDITYSLLRSILKKIAGSQAASTFFDKNSFCQVAFDSPKWTMQLRDTKRRVCYIGANLDGSEAAVIKRLYARNSQCQ